MSLGGGRVFGAPWERHAVHPYHRPYEHLLDELERVFLLAERAIRVVWSTTGLHHRLTPALSRLLGVTEIEDVDAQRRRLVELEEQAAQHGALLRQRCSASDDATLPLLRIRDLFHLDDFQIDIVLLALAPELDPRFETVFRYLQSDRQRAWVDVHLVAQILCRTPWQRRRLYDDFAAEGPLLDNHLIELLPAEMSAPASLLYRPLRANKALLDFVLGRRAVSNAYETVHEPDMGFDDVVLHADARDAATRLAAALAEGAIAAPVVILSGGSGVGKRATLKAIAAEAGLGLLELDMAVLPDDPAAYHRRIGEWLLRGVLQGCLCYASHLEESLGETRPVTHPKLVLLGRLLEKHAGPVALEWSSKRRPFKLRDRAMVPIALQVPDTPMQERLWRRELRKAGVWLPPSQIGELAMCYFVSGGTIHEALRAAAQDARTFSYSRLEQALRRIISSRLDELALRVDRLASWNELLVHDELRERIEGVIAQHRHRHTVLREWSIGPRLRLNPGVSVLFWGPPGTGKSMTAGVIAGELGFALYQVDLAMVMSKWLGETEKNLARIFDEAEAGQIVLLFDEADSLFSKRVSDNNTPQAQALAQRVNYILTRLERFRGVAILTSNRESDIDEAFERRLSAKIFFPMPEQATRRQLWSYMLGDWDAAHLDLLAECELAGGHIRNVCAGAAFDAAQEGTTLGQPHVVRVLKRVFGDMGRLAPSWLVSRSEEY